MSSGIPAYPYRAIATIHVPSHAFSAVTSFSPLPVIRPSTATPTNRTTTYTAAGASAGERTATARGSGGAVVGRLGGYDGRGIGGGVRGDVGGGAGHLRYLLVDGADRSVRRVATASGNDVPVRCEPRHMTMRRGMASARRHGRRAVAFGGVRPAPAGHAARRQIVHHPPGGSACLIPATAARRPARPPFALEWAIRSW